MAPNNTQSPQSPSSNQFDYLSAIALGQNPQDQSGNTTGPAVQGPSTGGSFVNGTYIPYNALANMPLPNPQQETQEVMKYLPEFSQGPYGQGSRQEQITAQQFANRANSPYMAFGANNRFAQAHPRAAGAIDNMLLGGSLVAQQHAASLAAGHGLEGAGGAIGDVLSGVMGIPQARMVYRQGLEQQGFQRQLEEAQVKTAQTENLRNLMQAISAYETNPARQAGEIARGLLAAQTNAQERGQATRMTNAEKLAAAMNNDATKQYVARIKAETSGLRPGSPQFAFHESQFENNLTNHIQKLSDARDLKIRQAQALQTSGLMTKQQFDDVINSANDEYDSQRAGELEIASRIAREVGYSDPYRFQTGQSAVSEPLTQAPPTYRQPVKPATSKSKPNATSPTSQSNMTISPEVQALIDKHKSQ